jgi:pyruvate dehydrogenase E1 component beta subunit
MGGSTRSGVTFNLPQNGLHESVSLPIKAIPLGKAILRRTGSDLTMVSIGVSVHRALESATQLAQNKISSDIIDLRTVSPLDIETIINSVKKTGRLLVIDEDYQTFGLSGEIAAICAEAGLSFTYQRVCTTETIPYSRTLEDQILPNSERIIKAALSLL